MPSSFSRFIYTWSIVCRCELWLWYKPAAVAKNNKCDQAASSLLMRVKKRGKVNSIESPLGSVTKTTQSSSRDWSLQDKSWFLCTIQPQWQICFQTLHLARLPAKSLTNINKFWPPHPEHSLSHTPQNTRVCGFWYYTPITPGHWAAWHYLPYIYRRINSGTSVSVMPSLMAFVMWSLVWSPVSDILRASVSYLPVETEDVTYDLYFKSSWEQPCDNTDGHVCELQVQTKLINYVLNVLYRVDCSRLKHTHCCWCPDATFKSA